MTKRKVSLSETESFQYSTKLAIEHWAWLQTLLEKIYKDAFIHGYKHGKEEK